MNKSLNFRGTPLGRTKLSTQYYVYNLLIIIYLLLLFLNKCGKYGKKL